MRKLLLLCICLTFTLITKAQTEDKKWNIGLHGGATQYQGDLGSDLYKTDMAFYGFAGLSVTRFIGSHFDINVLATKGTVGYSRANGRFLENVMTGTINFRFQILGPASVVRPYIFVGGGGMLFDKNILISSKQVDYVAPSFGAGVNFRLAPSIMLNLQEMYMYSTADNRDGVVGGTNDGYLFHMVGLTFNFGTKKDADKDGVADRIDKCPNTPPRVAVDKDGCPLDRDKDGVPDYMDACPDVAGTAATHGCPDRDGDGVADKDDNCPDIKGLVALHGCPDADGDGIPDYLDSCPNQKGTLALNGCPDRDGDGIADKDDLCPDVKGLAQFHGCPDTDGDGIEDSKDMCPDQKGPASTNGCPDTDGDGVPDNLDKCPTLAGSPAHHGCPDTDGDGVYDDIDNCITIPGPASNHGCPELKKETKQLFEKALQGIQFETGKAVIKPVSFPILNAIVKVMSDNPTYKLMIGGHTDDVGEDAMNMTLSEDRAAAVANYLISHGVDPLRVTSKGYGKTQPVDTNKSEKGRAHNRRVEFKVEFLQ